MPVSLRKAALSVLPGVLLVLPLAPPAAAAAIDTIARQAYLIDTSTDTVLLAKNADERMPTSSMSKIMTAYMVFERLKTGRMKLDDTLPVSRKAWEQQGSKMYVELNNNIKVEDLIRGMIIQSGNDACVVLAESMGGTEENFAANMTKRAKELGLANSNFMNASGWPVDGHYSTARDLGLLANRLIQDFPEYFHYYSEKEFKYHGINQGNRNPLLYRNMGVDGMKTGHTEIAGYGLIGTGERNGRRLILVVNGLPNMQARADESARLLEWGWREFETFTLFKAGETIDQVPVWLGRQERVALVADAPARITMTHEQRRQMKVTLIADAPLQAPVAKGTKVGTVRVEAPDLPAKEFPVVTAADVGKLGFFGRMGTALRYLFSGTPAPAKG